MDEYELEDLGVVGQEAEADVLNDDTFGGSTDGTIWSKESSLIW